MLGRRVASGERKGRSDFADVVRRARWRLSVEMRLDGHAQRIGERLSRAVCRDLYMLVVRRCQRTMQLMDVYRRIWNVED